MVARKRPHDDRREDPAGLSEVKGLNSSSRVAGRGQRDVLDSPTAAGAVLFRRSTEVASFFRLRALPEPRSGEVHGHQGVRMRGTYAGCELV